MSITIDSQPDEDGYIAIREDGVVVDYVSKSTLELLKLHFTDKVKERAQRGFLVFTGEYEILYNLSEAENRLEELLDAGHNWPTVVGVELTEEDNTEPLTMRAHKTIATGRAGEIL